ncbi:methyltransferase [Phenylobacterium sp.]|jgi:SAM-dependent methyltransferase|uniref:methyltransferase n=1 Tax=Phenylobacterium sp. TaxID=1871053 RepID=UPI002F418FC0
MKIGVLPESPLEWLGLRLGLVPVPLAETHGAMLLARAIMAGAELGVFDALAGGPRTAAQVAEACRTAPGATALLLDALAACGYLTRGGRGEGADFALAPQARKWLLAEAPASIRDKLLLQVVEWRWLETLEAFVLSGRPLDFHDGLPAAELGLYHRAMRALAGVAGHEVARRMPVPRGARRMLDLGGSHGHYAAEICRRHPGLSAEVLDLPDAIVAAAPILAREGLGERVVHTPGDAASADLGEARYDLVLMSNLAHHLDAAQNQALAHRVARALRPGGMFVIQEPALSEPSARAGQVTALLGLYFALQSRPDVRTWTVAEMAGWQAAAGLRPRRAVGLRTAPGWVQQAAVRDG